MEHLRPVHPNLKTELEIARLAAHGDRDTLIQLRSLAVEFLSQIESELSMCEEVLTKRDKVDLSPELWR